MSSVNPTKYKGWWVELNTLFQTTDVRVSQPETVQIYNMNKVHSFFSKCGWTHNAISGMLGNMMVESTVNPWTFQDRSLDWTDIQGILTTPGGMGLTQWTPARKYYQWATYEGKDPKDGKTMCERIRFEQLHNMQWSLENYGRHTWNDFVTSTEPAWLLADVFMWAYERPGDPDEEQRWTNAEWCFDNIHGLAPLNVLLFNVNKRKELKPPCRRI